MATFIKQITANDADACEKDDGTNFTADSAIQVADSNALAGSRWNSGMWFDNVTVPKGATIISAKLTLYIDGTKDDPNCDIYGNAVDSADDFADEADVTSRARTTASIPWVEDDIGLGSQDSPDIKSIIEELTSRAGWASGNNVCILTVGRSDADKLFRYYEGENFPGDGAILTIEYTNYQPRPGGMAVGTVLIF